jgi:hypothetical protein
MWGTPSELRTQDETDDADWGKLPLESRTEWLPSFEESQGYPDDSESVHWGV